MKRATLTQLIVLTQAAIVVGLGWYVGAQAASSKYANYVMVLRSMRENTSGIPVAVFIGLDLLARTALACACGAAVIWWLGQQKKLVRDLTRERIALPALRRRTKIVVASGIGILVLAASVLMFYRARTRPTPEPDLTGQFEQGKPQPTPSPTPESVPLDDLEKTQPK